MLASLVQCEGTLIRQGKSHPGQNNTSDDIHNGTHCVDVSYWGNVTKEDYEETCCETILMKKCEEICTRVSSVGILMDRSKGLSYF